MKSVFKFKLSGMPEGVPGQIDAVEAGAADRNRLAVLGLCPGRTVEVVQAGDPMIVRVLGTRIGLAAVLAGSVLVDVECGG